VKSIPAKEHIRGKGIAWMIPDFPQPGSYPEATDSMAVAFAMIYFSRFPPKKRMSSQLDLVLFVGFRWFWDI
jgi:hypothetical protein